MIASLEVIYRIERQWRKLAEEPIATTGREIQYLITMSEPASGRIEQRIIDAIARIQGVIKVEPLALAEAQRENER